MRPRRLGRSRLGALACVTALGVALLPASSAASPTAAAGAAAALPTAVAPVSLAPLPAALIRPAVVPTAVAHPQISRDLAARSAAAVGAGWVGLSVKDAASGTPIRSVNESRGRMPASTMKLVTAAATLTAYSPNRRIFTTVWSQFPGKRRVHLIAGGDPSLSSADLRALAAKAAVSIRRSSLVSGRPIRPFRVRVDDAIFAPPTLAYGWPSHYLPRIARPVRALVRDGRVLSDTTQDAAEYFAYRLKQEGIPVRKITRGPADTATANRVARVGNPLRPALATMLRDSDNNLAEMLHRLVAIKLGYPGTWEGGRAATMGILAQHGLDLTNVAIHDGSGLSRNNRLTAGLLTDLMRVTLSTRSPRFRAMYDPDAMPIAGRTGTLRASYGRFTQPESVCAAGKALAKTGTLSGAVGLTGVVSGADGRPKVFSFLLNGEAARNPREARRSLDSWTAIVAGCLDRSSGPAS